METHRLQFYPQTGGVTGGTDGVTGQFWSIGVGTLIEDQLTGTVLVNKSTNIQVRFKSGGFKALKKQPPGGANRSVSDAEADTHNTQHTTHRMYHEVPQLQTPLAADEEGVVLPDDHALWLAEGGSLFCELRCVAHFGFDLHVGWHDSTEHVQNRQGWLILVTDRWIWNSHQTVNPLTKAFKEQKNKWWINRQNK